MKALVKTYLPISIKIKLVKEDDFHKIKMDIYKIQKKIILLKKSFFSKQKKTRKPDTIISYRLVFKQVKPGKKLEGSKKTIIILKYTFDEKFR